MGPPLTDTGDQGSGLEDVGAIMRCGYAGNTTIRVGDLGGDLSHGADPGGVPLPGSAENHGEATKATYGWGLGIPPYSTCAKGGGH